MAIFNMGVGGKSLKNATKVEGDVAATAGDLLEGQIAFVNGEQIVGTRQAVTSIILDNGDTIAAAEVDSTGVAPEITATKNDIREGKTASTNQGVVTGTKRIPSYETSQGTKIIPVGSQLEITIDRYDLYDYTFIQCIICKWDTDLPSSLVDTHKVIGDSVYATGSATAIAILSKDAESKTINFGITNTDDVPLVIRYVTYKEIE